VAERNRLVHDPASVPQLAPVAAMHGELAELMLEGAEAPVSIPIPDLELLDSAFVGAALALRFERIGVGQTLLKALPAIKLDDGGDSRIYPYERPLPDAGGPLALAAAVVGAPTIRRPRRIPIAGQRNAVELPTPATRFLSLADRDLLAGMRCRVPTSGTRARSRRSSRPAWRTTTTGADRTPITRSSASSSPASGWSPSGHTNRI
jgi:hypothetical protein